MMTGTHHVSPIHVYTYHTFAAVLFPGSNIHTDSLVRYSGLPKIKRVWNNYTHISINRIKGYKKDRLLNAQPFFNTQPFRTQGVTQTDRCYQMYLPALRSIKTELFGLSNPSIHAVQDTQRSQMVGDPVSSSRHVQLVTIDRYKKSTSSNCQRLLEGFKKTHLMSPNAAAYFSGSYRVGFISSQW